MAFVGNDPSLDCSFRALTCFQRNELSLFSAIDLENRLLLAFRIKVFVLFRQILY